MFKAILLLFFPKRCVCCYEILDVNEKEICTSCRHELPLIDNVIFKKNYIEKVFNETIDIENFSSLFYFEKNTEVQELLHNLKYRGHQYIGTLIGNWHASILSKNDRLKDVDVVIPMPIHKVRLKKRSYNQVSLYAKAIAEELKVNYREDILVKTKYNKSQVFLTKSERFDNILDAISVVDISEIEGKHILLVDDLITTGATMSACVSCLKEINCKISIASMALAHNDEHM